MNKKKLLLIGGGIILMAGIGYTLQRKKPAKTLYEDVKVSRDKLEMMVLATGTVQPENRLEIKSPVAGRVESVLIKEGQVVKKGQLLAWMSSTERAALLDAARAKGEEEVKKWEDLYRQTPVVSPINGTIILKNVESGQTFTNADAIFVLSNRLTVKAQVDETDIASIKVNQKAEIVLDAYAENRISAIVAAIAYDATTVNNVTTYVVDVAPEKTPEFMRSGMTANVNFLVSSKKDILVVPNSAIEINENGATVLSRGADGKKKLVVVKTGMSDGKITEVIEGLTENDIVLVKQLGTSDDEKGFNPFSPFGRRKKGR